MNKSKLLILGTGFGGFSLVKQIDLNLFEVLVVSPRNHFLFTPLLASTTVGTLEFRSIVEPVRSARKGIAYYQAECTLVDPSEKRIECLAPIDQRRFLLPYDILVIAVGAVNNTYGVPGVAEHALFLKELSDARKIRQGIIERLEQAAQPGLTKEERIQLLHFVVVGGGPTGVEFAAEMHDFLADELTESYPTIAPDVRITLLEATDQVLNTFDAELGQYAIRHFRRQNIDIRTGSPVVRVEKQRIVLKDGSEIHCGLIIWSAGIAPTPFIQSLEFAKNHGRLITDDHLRVEGVESIFAIGDCAIMRDKSLPITAQLAQQQGKYLARALKRKSEGKSIEPFRFKNYGMLAYIGGNKALADMSKLKGKGFTIWLLWRSVYLTKLVSLKNKILVLFDWWKTAMFGRDISRF